MNGMTRGLWLSAAATIAIFTTACGDIGPTDAGSGCSTDSNCATGKVCHPVLKSCVASCTGSSDCPAAEKTCAKFDGTAATASAPGFCQCSTDALCSNSVAGNICSTATLQCTAKCTSNASCPGTSTCNTTTGQCSGGSTDAGSDAGMTMDAGTDAGLPMTCTSSNTQPDVCGHGNVCTSANTCEVVTDGTCTNIANGKSAPGSTTPRTPFVAATSTGPVIFNVVDETTNDDAFCTMSQTAFTFTVYAYSATGTTFPATGAGLSGFYYYRTDGSAVAMSSGVSFRPSGYTQLAGGAMASVKLTLCSDTVVSSLQIGVGFTNGNGYCAMIAR